MKVVYKLTQNLKQILENFRNKLITLENFEFTKLTVKIVM